MFGADIIAGFPTETEAMFENSLKLVEECGLTWLHVFPYSARKGTPAAKMPQVLKAVRKERARRLREVGEARVAAYLAAEIGAERQVLMETRITSYNVCYTKLLRTLTKRLKEIHSFA